MAGICFLLSSYLNPSGLKMQPVDPWRLLSTAQDGSTPESPLWHFLRKENLSSSVPTNTQSRTEQKLSYEWFLCHHHSPPVQCQLHRVPQTSPYRVLFSGLSGLPLARPYLPQQVPNRIFCSREVGRQSAPPPSSPPPPSIEAALSLCLGPTG